MHKKKSIKSVQSIAKKEDDVYKDILNSVSSGKYEEKTYGDLDVSNLSDDTLYALAWYYVCWAEKMAKEDNIELVNLKYAKALEIKPDLHEAYYNWAIYLNERAKVSSEQARLDLYDDVFNKYSRSIEIKPEHDTYYNWGNALMEKARLSMGQVKLDLYDNAFDKYSKSLAIQLDHDTYYNWGAALMEKAKLTTGQAQLDLYDDAFVKFAKVVEIEPNDYKAYSRWGCSLARKAKLTRGQARLDLYDDAFDKFAKVVEIKQNSHRAYDNWGNALMEKAKITTGQIQLDLYYQALEKQQLCLKHGGSSYNLACLYALLNDTDQALFYLEICLKSENCVGYVEADSDFDSLRLNTNFISLLEKYKPPT